VVRFVNFLGKKFWFLLWFSSPRRKYSELGEERRRKKIWGGTKIAEKRFEIGYIALWGVTK
jgi:hypothetical protein